MSGTPDGEERTARRLAVLYLCQTLVTVVLLACLMPLLGNPDETNHFRRVDQIAQGGLVAHRRQGDRFWSGGTVAPGIEGLAEIFRLDGPTPITVTRGALRAQDRVAWGDRVPTSFPNTSIYPPVLYLPAVAGDRLGRLLGLRVARTALLARLCDGVVDTLVIAAAIAAAGGAAPWLMALASLPMSLSLLAAIGQDGGMLACAAAAVAFSARGARGGDGRRLALLAAALALLASARPVYLPFAVAVLLPGTVPIGRRAVAFAAVLLAVGAWSAIDAARVITAWPALFGADPRGQLAFLLAHPWRAWTVARATFAGVRGEYGQSFWEQAVGVLGPLDVTLPGWFYRLAGPVLGLAALPALLRRQPAVTAAGSAMLFAAGLAATWLVFLFQYVDVTRVGAASVAAVQGRYFLPIGLLVPLALPRLGIRCDPARRAAVAGVALFTTLSCAVAVTAVLRRYWL